MTKKNKNLIILSSIIIIALILIILILFPPSEVIPNNSVNEVETGIIDIQGQKITPNYIELSIIN